MTHTQSILRARAGLFLNGPMPTYHQIMRALGVSRYAAIRWHSLIARARREFA